jgi:alkaline phosphatase
LGGGIGKNSDKNKDHCSQYAGDDILDVVSLAKKKGFAVATSQTELMALVDDGLSKILGLFADQGKTPEIFRVEPLVSFPVREPTLPVMTAAALRVLEKNPAGFFLMVEGSQIDWANHAKNFRYQLGETLAFNAAVEVVLQWLHAHPSRAMNTLLIVVPDHETGGFAINGPTNHLAQKGELIEAGWTFPLSIEAQHTAVDTMLWSHGPGSACLNRALDNTELFHIMKQVMQYRSGGTLEAQALDELRVFVH